MNKQKITAYHDLKSICDNIAKRMSGDLLFIGRKYQTGFCVINIILNGDKNYGGNYIFGNRDMRYFVSNINAELKLAKIKDYTYILKPKPQYYTTDFSEKIYWNLGYDTNKIKISVTL